MFLLSCSNLFTIIVAETVHSASNLFYKFELYSLQKGCLKASANQRVHSFLVSGCNSLSSIDRHPLGEGIHGSRGLVVPARFWQEHNNRIRRQTETPSFDISSILAYDHEHQCYFNLVDKGY